MSKKDIENQAELLAAAKDLNITAIQSFLEAKINPNVQDQVQRTPLHLVFSKALPSLAEKTVEAAALLLRFKANVNAQNKNGDTPLILAVKNKRTKAVSMLLGEAKADVNTANSVGDTALHYSAASGDEQITRLLLSFHADCNAKNKQGKTPEMLAKYSGKPNTQEMTSLLERARKKNVNVRKIKDKDKQVIPQTPLSGREKAERKFTAMIEEQQQNELKKVFEKTDFLKPLTPQQQLDIAIKNKEVDQVKQLFDKDNSLFTTDNVVLSFQLGVHEAVCEIFKRKLMNSKSADMWKTWFAAFLSQNNVKLTQYKSTVTQIEDLKSLDAAQQYLTKELKNIFKEIKEEKAKNLPQPDIIGSGGVTPEYIDLQRKQRLLASIKQTHDHIKLQMKQWKNEIKDKETLKKLQSIQQQADTQFELFQNPDCGIKKLEECQTILGGLHQTLSSKKSLRKANIAVLTSAHATNPHTLIPPVSQSQSSSSQQNRSSEAKYGPGHRP